MPADEKFGLLADGNFRLFIAGRLVTSTGTYMVPVALSFAVLKLTGSAGDVGFVLAAETAPMLLLLLVGGAVADILPRRWVMVGADGLRFASEGAMAALLFAGRPPLWQIAVLGAILGVGSAFSSPAASGLLPEFLAAERLQGANALSGMANSTGLVLGPSLAGGLVAAFGSAPAIGFDAFSFAVSAVCLSSLRLKPWQRETREAPWAALRSGWQEFRSHTWLWVIVLQWTFFNPLCSRLIWHWVPAWRRAGTAERLAGGPY